MVKEKVKKATHLLKGWKMEAQVPLLLQSYLGGVEQLHTERTEDTHPTNDPEGNSFIIKKTSFSFVFFEIRHHLLYTYRHICFFHKLLLEVF